jgi:filamentous hemagglutinin family protein
MSRSDLCTLKMRNRIFIQFSFLFGLWLLAISFFSCPGEAQVPASKPITSSGLNTAVSNPITIGNQTQYNITGGTRPGGGTNLFHSFGNFTVPNNNIANFLNDSGLPTSNILGRVTGGNISNIFGTIQTNGPSGFGNANLFLMNPAGFLFGPNATINVGGMVAITSADYLRLEGIGGNGIFHADPAQTSVLTSAPVAAFGFLGSSPGAITVQGSQLSVTPGQAVSLVGGNITVESGTLENGMVQTALLSAPGGQVNFASVASPGEILAETLNLVPNINGQVFGTLGSIKISQKSIIDVSGEGGGTVRIRGGRFLLDDSTIFNDVLSPTEGPPGAGIDIVVSQDAVIRNGALLETSVLGDAVPGVQYGGVHVKADRIEIIGSEDAVNFPLTGVSSTVTPESSVNGGNILLEANSILVKDFGLGTTIVETTTLGDGNAGKVSVHATGNLEIDGGVVDSFAVFGSGHAGDIEMSSTQGNIVMTNAAFVSSQASPFSSGNSGAILLDAPNGNISLADMTQISNAARGTGSLGGININAQNLTLANSGISGDNLATNPAGDMTINLSGILSVGGTSFPSFIQTVSRGSAPAADLNITAKGVAITDGAFLSTETFSSGPGGHLNIATENLQLTKGGQLRSGSTMAPSFPGEPSPEIPTGSGGTITVLGHSGPAGSILIDGTDSGIFTNAAGTGAGGNINILANSVALQNGGTLSAATTGVAPSATGGMITVNAEHVAVNSQASITTDTNGIAPAGVVDINTGTLAINGGGQIRSSSGAEVEQVSAFALSSTGAPSLTGGTITVQGQSGNGSQADSVAIDGAGSGVFTESTGSRPGGDINLLTSQSVTMTNGASISASSTGTGNAGNINVNAGNQLNMTNSTVTTEATKASGGAIKITTTPSGTVELTNSTISASVLDGTGGGGNVDIDPQFVILQNSQILANAVSGPGGNINITTNLLLPDPASRIEASSQFGQQGNIVIQSPVSPASGKIVPLGQKPLVHTALLSQRCAALAGGNASSFTVAGRDSLPAEPGGWISSPLALSIAESADGTLTEKGTHTGQNQVAEEAPLLSLRKMTPAGFLTQSFGAASSDCQS